MVAYLAQFAQGSYEIRPLAGVFEIAQRLINVCHILSILCLGHELLLLHECVRRLHGGNCDLGTGTEAAKGMKTTTITKKWLMVNS